VSCGADKPGRHNAMQAKTRSGFACENSSRQDINFRQKINKDKDKDKHKKLKIKIKGKTEKMAAN
jgi:hypothetical protein